MRCGEAATGPYTLRMRVLGIVCAWWVISPVAAPAAAQPASSSTESHEGARGEARATYDQGMQAAREGRWDDALDSFESAYQLHPDERLLINIAGALTQLGRLAEAERQYQRFLAEMDSDADQYREAAERALERIGPRLATVVVLLPARVPGDRLTVDGRTISAAELMSGMRLEAGEHRLHLLRGGNIVRTLDLDVEEGETTTVSVATVAIHPQPDLEGEATETALDLRAPPPPDGSDGFWQSPWPWVGAAALLSASVVLIVLLASGNTSEVDRTPQFTGTLTPGRLRAR